MLSAPLFFLARANARKLQLSLKYMMGLVKSLHLSFRVITFYFSPLCFHSRNMCFYLADPQDDGGGQPVCLPTVPAGVFCEGIGPSVHVHSQARRPHRTCDKRQLRHHSWGIADIRPPQGQEFRVRGGTRGWACGEREAGGCGSVLACKGFYSLVPAQVVDETLHRPCVTAVVKWNRLLLGVFLKGSCFMSLTVHAPSFGIRHDNTPHSRTQANRHQHLRILFFCQYPCVFSILRNNVARSVCFRGSLH